MVVLRSAHSKRELVETKQKLGVEQGKQAELRAMNEQQILSVLRQFQARQETQLALLQREVALTHMATTNAKVAT